MPIKLAISYSPLRSSCAECLALCTPPILFPSQLYTSDKFLGLDTKKKKKKKKKQDMRMLRVSSILFLSQFTPFFFFLVIFWFSIFFHFLFQFLFGYSCFDFILDYILLIAPYFFTPIQILFFPSMFFELFVPQKLD